jgi:hypothetical protein
MRKIICEVSVRHKEFYSEDSFLNDDSNIKIQINLSKYAWKKCFLILIVRAKVTVLVRCINSSETRNVTLLQLGFFIKIYGH